MHDHEAHLVRSSWDRLRSTHGAVARSVATKLFAARPDLARLFDESDVEWQRDIFELMIAQVVRAADDAVVLATEVAESGRRHVVYGVRNADYAVLGDALLDALAEHLGGEFTSEVRDAWRAVYDRAATAMRQ